MGRVLELKGKLLAGSVFSCAPQPHQVSPEVLGCFSRQPGSTVRATVLLTCWLLTLVRNCLDNSPYPTSLFTESVGMHEMDLDEPKAVERIAILGAGTIGASWAAHFLGRGISVAVSDPDPDSESRVRAFVQDAWPTVQRLGGVADANPENMRFFRDPEDAVAEAQFVQENAPEDLQTKSTLYEDIEGKLPRSAVVASSTSGLLISELQAGRLGPERYIVGHPFNPPHIVPLVEVVGGKETDPAVVDWTIAFYNAHGKRAIRIRKEVLGHLANRLQAALFREAVHAVDTGMATVEDVDTAIAYGPGLRLALMGPILINHLSGGEGGMHRMLEHFGPAIEKWWSDLGTPCLSDEVARKLCEGLEDEVSGRPVADLAKERDVLLVALLEMLKQRRQK